MEASNWMLSFFLFISKSKRTILEMSSIPRPIGIYLKCLDVHVYYNSKVLSFNVKLFKLRNTLSNELQLYDFPCDKMESYLRIDKNYISRANIFYTN
jgi:hypothetical protein